MLICGSAVHAQTTESELFTGLESKTKTALSDDIVMRGQAPSPGGALLRSVVLPGWGQYYADKSSWRRGQFHLASDLALVGTLIYLHTNANMLENNMFTHAQAFAGIDLRSVPRNVEIAVGGHNSLGDFNETQLRTRNWDRLIDDRPEFRWNWDNETRRGEYVRLRDRRDRARQQIPAVATLMVVNRVVSGIHAFIVARNQNELLSGTQIGFHLPEVSGGQGMAATISLSF